MASHVRHGGNTVIWRWLLAGQFRSFPFRYIFAALSIAVGIALGFSVHVMNASASDAFGDAVRNMSGAADAQIAGATSLGFDEQLYPRIYKLPETADVSPVIEMNALIGAGKARAKLIGIDPFRAAAITPLLLGRQDMSKRQSAGRAGAKAAFDMNAIYLSAAALEMARASVGSRVLVRANGRAHEFVVAGDLPGIAAGQAVATIDIATAQWRFDRLGRLDRLDIKRAPATVHASLMRALSAALPRDARITGAENETQKRTQLSRAYRVNLEMLALVALVTGGFLVYSAQSLSAQTQQRQFALLRILGLQKESLRRQLLVEGFVLGIAGSILGLVLGYGFARLVLAFVGSDLGAGYFSGTSAPVHVTAAAVLVFLVFGIGTAILGSLAPAQRAGQLQPAQAIKAPDASAGGMNDPVWMPGLGLIVTGGALTLLPAVGGLPVFGYIAVAAVLAGAIWLTPWLARTLLRPLTKVSGRAVSFDLALYHLMRSPGQAAAALGGIVASVGLMIAMAIMVSSFRTSVDSWLGSILSADLYVSGGLAGTSFDTDEQIKIAGLPGVAAAEFSKTISISLNPQQPPVALIVRPVATSRYPLPFISEAARKGKGIPVWVSEPASRIYDLKPGDSLRLPVGKRGASAYVAGIWSDYARQQGAMTIESRDYSQLTGDTQRSEIAITLQESRNVEAQIEGLSRRIDALTGTRVEISNAGNIRKIALGLFDRSFAITYGLEAIAILIGMVGVGATFAAQVGTRVKEFGMLRHIGFDRRQIIAMLAGEGFLLGTIGLAAGLASGLAISQILVHVINPQSFNLTMTTHIPVTLLATVSAALLITSAATAVLSGRHAVGKNVLRAVNEDW